MALSPIVRVGASGYINVVNDAVIGMPTAPGGVGVTKFAGQLGKLIELDDSQVRYNSAVGTVYGGVFQYVRLAASSAVPIIGQQLFWDSLANAADNLYQVTTSETAGTTDSAVNRAGTCLSASLTVGNYTWIQISGPIFCKFRAVLTDPAAIGNPVYCAGAGGADLGFADVIENPGAASQQDVTLFQRRYLGVARQLPVAGGLTLVDVPQMFLRG